MSDPLTLAFCLAKFAPKIVKWISGSDKAEKAAADVVSIAERVTGVSGDSIIPALADPALAIQFRQAVMASEADLDKAYLADTANARAMQVAALGQDDKFSKRFVYIFAAYWSLVSSAYIGFITFGEIPANNVRFADTILGFLLGTLIATIIQYFYGSSRSSSGKTEVMASLLNKTTDK